MSRKNHYHYKLIREVNLWILIKILKEVYENFIKKASDSKTVWELISIDGWCVCESNEYDDNFKIASCIC